MKSEQKVSLSEEELGPGLFTWPRLWNTGA
jgi:hypothetical protein